MRNLSEEEIIKIIKEYLSKIYIEYTKVGAVGIPNEEWYAIQGLLDLYNKEKEKNIPLIIDGKSINAYADEIEDLLSIEDGTPVYFSIGERQAIKIISRYCRNSVPKSEIKELDNLKYELQQEKEKNKELKEKYSKKLIELQKEREKSEHLLDEGIVTYFDDDELKESVGNYLGILLKKNIEKDYISKDKIKAKIEEVKDGTFDAKIVLQSLLEKE